MTPFLQLALALAILLVFAKAGGYLSYRLGQPSVLGELIAGILIGPTVLNLLHMPFFSSEALEEMIHVIAELGVLFLMFLAGLELHLSDLAKSGKVSALAGTLGVFVPIGLSLLLPLIFPMPFQEAIFVGLILAATSVSISAQTLMELGFLRSRVGISLLGAAVFDDILDVLALSIFLAVAVGEGESGGLGTVLGVVLRMVLFLGIASALGFWLLPKLSRRVQKLPISQGLIAFTIVTILIYGWGAETLGSMAAITGAFLAGLILARSPVKERLESGMLTLSYSFFVPIFFINIGLTANMRELIGPAFSFFLVMLVIAILGKVLGAGAGALLGGFDRREALQLGIGMMSRGEVGLIVASVGVTTNTIPESVFSAVVGVVIVTTLLTPLLLRASFRRAAPAMAAPPALPVQDAPVQAAPPAPQLQPVPDAAPVEVAPPGLDPEPPNQSPPPETTGVS